MFNLLVTTMSRIGQQPINIPEAVEIKTGGSAIVISGPKGQLSQDQMEGITCQIEDSRCLVRRADDSKHHRAKHGLMRSLLANMVLGVTEGFEKQLEVVGIGYRVRLEGQSLILNVGFSHEVRYQVPEDIKPVVEDNNITVSGINKQRVGQVAAAIRDIKKPEPYKGKGIRYQGEVVRRKVGKGAKES